MATRLPGLSFESVAPRSLPGLPRMDVALFAGFAARGPCHRALTLDSARAFEETFGDTLPLARDDARDEVEGDEALGAGAVLVLEIGRAHV